MVWSHIVLGIGNPGPEYEKTRHNAGFMVLDRLAVRSGVAFQRLPRKAADGTRLFSGKVKAKVATGLDRQGRPFLLVKPWTYVNLSGDVAAPLLAASGLDPDALFVVVDDLNLPLGRIRIRPSGSHGGHNGLRHIEEALGTRDYPRLRLGIGRATDLVEPSDSTDPTQVDFVLGEFLPEERAVVEPALERAADCVEQWLDGAEFQVLMSAFNGGPEGLDAASEPSPSDPLDPRTPGDPQAETRTDGPRGPGENE